MLQRVCPNKLPLVCSWPYFAVLHVMRRRQAVPLHPLLVDDDPQLDLVPGHRRLSQLPFQVLPPHLTEWLTAHNYVPAAAQAALLQTYGGVAVASVPLAKDLRRPCNGAGASAPPDAPDRGAAPDSHETVHNLDRDLSGQFVPAFSRQLQSAVVIDLDSSRVFSSSNLAAIRLTNGR